MMGKGFERFCDVWIVDETNSFRLDFGKKTGSGFWSASPDVGAVLYVKKKSQRDLMILENRQL